MQSRANPVGRDVQNVVSEAQELLKTVKDEGASRMDDVKSRMDDVKTRMAGQYEHARARVDEVGHQVQEGARLAMTTTDEYVRSNPWRAVGIAAAAGALIGFLASRR